MTLSTLDKVLWVASLVGHATLTFVLVFRKRWREFPVFTSFLVYEALSTILLVVVSNNGSKHAYFLAYWGTGFGNYAYQVAVVYEIARDVLRPTGRWVQEARRSFLLWGGLGLVAAAALALQLGPTQSRGLALWDARIEVFTSLLTCELFLAMSVAANRLGLQRRSHVVALGAGITVWACVALMQDFVRAVVGWDRKFVTLSHAGMLAYLLVLAYWIVAFWLPEKGRAPLSPEMRRYLLALRAEVHYDLQDVDGPLK